MSDQYITALAIAPSATNTIYAATAGGQLFVTQNDGGTWTEEDTGLPVDSYDQIVSIQVNPTNANEVFIVPGRFPTNVFGPARVWMTTTGGAKVGANNGWTEITGNLPSEDYTNSIAVDWRPATPVLYVATARGVYQSADLGGHWTLFGDGLPNSQVTDLQLDTGLNVLAAATYGRGVWEIQLGAVNSVWTGGGGNANWNTAANWAGDSVPAAGDNLVFPAGAAQMTNSNNLTAGTEFGNIVFGTGGYSLSGNAIELDGTIDGSASAGNTTFNIPVTLEGASSVVTGGVASLITLGQTINTNGYTLSVGGGVGQASFTSAISGAGGLSVDAGNSTVTLSGTNTYGGGTAVTAGTLIVSSARPRCSADRTCSLARASSRPSIRRSARSSPPGPRRAAAASAAKRVSAPAAAAASAPAAARRQSRLPSQATMLCCCIPPAGKDLPRRLPGGPRATLHCSPPRPNPRDWTIRPNGRMSRFRRGTLCWPPTSRDHLRFSIIRANSASSSGVNPHVPRGVANEATERLLPT